MHQKGVPTRVDVLKCILGEIHTILVNFIFVLIKFKNKPFSQRSKFNQNFLYLTYFLRIPRATCIQTIISRYIKILFFRNWFSFTFFRQLCFNLIMSAQSWVPHIVKFNYLFFFTPHTQWEFILKDLSPN